MFAIATEVTAGYLARALKDLLGSHHHRFVDRQALRMQRFVSRRGHEVRDDKLLRKEAKRTVSGGGELISKFIHTFLDGLWRRGTIEESKASQSKPHQ